VAVIEPFAAGPETTKHADLSVAVVIPCHNYGHFLAEAIESVLTQTRPADEILVVDDCSTDDTADVAARFADRVRYSRITGGSPSAARNAGVRSVDTDLVVFLDADDRFEKSFIERCVDALPDDWKRYFAYTHFRRFGNADTVETVPVYDRARLARSNFIHPASLFPREAVARIGYDENLKIGLEDWDLYLTLAEDGIEGVLVDEPLLLYRLHGDGVTWRLRRKPIRLCALRLRLLAKHRELYEPAAVVRQIADTMGLLVTDTEERYQLRRRFAKVRALAKSAVARPG
jgi:glycosyltransferase involved in cell wall biosynthesis